MDNDSEKNVWLRRELCDMVTYCDLNSLYLTRDTLLMVLVSLNFDEEKSKPRTHAVIKVENNGKENDLSGLH